MERKLQRIKRRYLALKRQILTTLATGGIKHAINYLYFKMLTTSKNSILLKWLYSVAPYPICVEIETTTRCHMKCIMCEHTYWNEPARDMSFEEFKAIVDQFPRLKWIGLTGIGESFLNKDFMKMLRYLKSKSVYIEIYDTFYLVDKKIAEELINLRIDRILPSIDGATKETYERIRVGSNFERVIENVRYLSQLKNRKSLVYPDICFHYIVTKINLHEMLPYIELVHTIVKDMEVSIQFTRALHSFEEIEDLFIEIPPEVITAVEKKAKELGIHLIWNIDVSQDKLPIYRCTAWIEPFIFATGHVIPCCAGNEANRREFQKKYSLGNVFEQSFREIWKGKEYRNFRKMLSKNKVPIQCKNCSCYDTRGR
ncbi:MAG: radical SAM protein [bacterium]|nr:radical SAM protein [bacterium]